MLIYIMNTETMTQYVQNFRTPAFPGSFVISFEGIEGAGKSTQIIKAKSYLESKGYSVIVLREPGGTSFGERLRESILSAKNDLHPLAEVHLFASSRAQLLHEVTLKELNNPGTVIIYDRYIDSSIAYQGVARGVGAETILSVHQQFPLNLMPHKTFYLHIPLELSHLRQKMRDEAKDYFERENDDFYAKLIEGYEVAKKLFPERIETIDGSKDPETVFKDIAIKLDQLISTDHDSSRA